MPHHVTLKKVAALAGVSYQTVSKVLNHQVQVSSDTEQRILNAVESLGYRPNMLGRNLRSRRTHLIGYSWQPNPHELDNPILNLFVQSMLNAVEGSGYNLLCFRPRPGAHPVDAYRELVRSNRVDAFVLSNVEYEDPRLQFLIEQHFPFVAFGRSNPELDFPYVDVDGAAGIRAVTRHLIEWGHRRIGVLTWPEGSRVGEDRLEGYFTALHDAGISPQRNFIVRGDGIAAFGKEATQRWLEQAGDQRPTAIIAFNDLMAVGAMQAIHARGLAVGQDIAVTGFDDSPLAQYLSPPLTSIRQPIWEIGQHMVGMIVDMLENRPLIYRYLLMQPELVIRQSSAFKLA